MFECPICRRDAKTLVGSYKHGRGVCWECADVRKESPFNYQLHQTDISDGTTKVTMGKRWEIENRWMTPEGQVINRKTGRPADR